MPFWMFFKILKNPKKLFEFIREWLQETNSFLEEFRETLTKFTGIIAPYMAPIGAIAITYDHLVNHQIMSIWFALPVLITLEILGFAITEIRLKIISHNRIHVGERVVEKKGKKRMVEVGKKKKLSINIANNLLLFYGLTVLVLVIAPSRYFNDPWAITITKIFVASLSLLGAFTAGLREQYEDLRKMIEKSGKPAKADSKPPVKAVKESKPKDLRETYESLSQNHQKVLWAYVEKPDASRKDVGEQIGGVTPQRVSQIIGDLKKRELLDVNGVVHVAQIESVERIPIWE